MRWLSCGKVMFKLHELKNELVVFLLLKIYPNFVLLTSEKWLEKLSFLSDKFSHLN